MEPIRPRSNMWYLLPIFAGLIGGFIAYWILRNDDPHKAKKCLYIGIVSLIAGIIINVLMGTQIPNVTPGINVNV